MPVVSRGVESAATLVRLIGRRYRMPMRIGELVTHVNVTDARMNFGRILVLVEPVTGTGSAWVELASLGALVEPEAQPVTVEPVQVTPGCNCDLCRDGRRMRAQQVYAARLLDQMSPLDPRD